MNGIIKTKGVCGGRACIENSRIPVWILVELRAQGTPDNDILSAYPTINRQKLDDAWLYAEQNEPEIENDISANDITARGEETR